jgi:hypothetical protein
MTTLFRSLQPAQKFRITVGALAKHAVRLIAQLLKIPKHLIVRVECWAYIIFVHRTDKGGQFISYRRLQHWLNAIACQIQNCSTPQQLRQLWLAIEDDWNKHKKQYDEKTYLFLSQIWTKRWENLVGCVATHPTDRYMLKPQSSLSQNQQVQAEATLEPNAPPLA